MKQARRPSTRLSRLSLLALVVVIAVCAAFAVIAWHPAIEPITPPTRVSFSPDLIEQGARMAAIGNCMSCHTAAEMPPYSGGVAIGTPFGKIFSTNITPEPKTGIGTWSQEAFRRAMHEGIARNGQQLYPAFPYDHFAKTSDNDVKALYAFLMTRDPVVAPPRKNELAFPLGFRPLVAGWNLLFLDRTPFHPDPSQGDLWNRGAYLATSMGHCSACHSPRNALGAEIQNRYLAGGEAQDWYVPALNAGSLSPLPWTTEQVTAYLRTGLAPDHAVAAGPMQEVVDNLGRADEKDIHAIAVYITSTLGIPSMQQQALAKKNRQRAALSSLSLVRPTVPAGTAENAELMELGATAYAGACASCHDSGRQISSRGALPLPLAIAVHEPDARNLIHIIREGITPGMGQSGRWMPGFATALTDEQLGALVAYLRRYAANAPDWPNVASAIQKAKSP